VQEANESPSTRPGDAPNDARPLLVYDSDCAFCVFWARYWQKLTADAVHYRPYQEAAAHHPEIPLADFQRAVQYIPPEGRRASAAEASFLTLSHARGKGFWLALYRRLPGFAAISELIYAFIAAHRAAFYRISLFLWGRDYGPPRYDLVSFLFLRLFGLIYLAAFTSFGVQALGLIGSHGILPLAELVEAVGGRAGTERFFVMPMLFWISAGDFAIQAVCWAGAAFSLLLIFNVLPRLSLFLLYVLYLSLLYGGQTFMSFQWDTFLLEAGFLGLLMSFARVPGIWLLRWLLFRFMFMSGVVGAAISFFHAAPAHAAGLVRRAIGAVRVETRDRGLVCRRAGAAVSNFLPAAAAFLGCIRHLAVAKLHSAHRQLQLVQSSDHVAVLAAV
jgi:predicted DCC family thiol-disulfide oxidoreductase YuxK